MKLPFFKKKKIEPIIEELPRPSFDDLNELARRVEDLEQIPWASFDDLDILVRRIEELEQAPKPKAVISEVMSEVVDEETKKEVELLRLDINKFKEQIESVKKVRPVVSEAFIKESSAEPCPHQIQGALDATIIQKELLIKKGVFTRDEMNEAYAELRTKRGK